jgi:transposase InsO family protein
MRFGFIRDHQEVYPVELMCSVLEVSRAGYYAWCERPESPRRQKQEQLVAAIERSHRESHGIYGSPRVYRDLIEQGHRTCENTVAKLMRRRQIRSKLKRRFVVQTTDSRHPHPIAPNRLNRQFDQASPDRVWTSDITYVPTDEGWLYLAVVMDACSRRIVGWSMADHMEASLVIDALEMALHGRRPAAGLILHSDRGVQYACGAYQSLLARHGLVCSMSGRGSCYDNAVTESFNGTLKTEWVYHEHYATREQARRSVFEFIEIFYNRKRRHSSLGYKSPEAFEAGLN